MAAPFSYDELISRSQYVNGASELLSQTPVLTRVISAEEVEEEYSFWDEDQGFGSSDFTYAIQSFLENVIAYTGLPYRTQFNPSLEVVQS